VAVAPLRAEPAADAEQVTQALRGEPLRLEERRGPWARVLTAYDYPGWLQQEALEEGEGAFPAPEEAPPFELARTYLGAPYLWGGMTDAGIDCSGLVHMAYRRSGRLVPRDAWQQAEAASAVGEPAPGDLVFYADSGRPVDHVAFWAGGGRILHSTGRDGLGVVEENEPPSLRERRTLAARL
jgi:gamma-D-glutamyl-L-lysine dipeptidyl-peptidase